MSNTSHTLTWGVMGDSVTGASHVASNKPNQDAILCSPGDKKDLPLILAVADGHGSSKNFRSAIGANFAVEIAVEELRNFANSLVGVSSPTTLKDRYERVPQQIVRRWREKTTAHWKDHKPTDEEWKLLNGLNQEKRPDIWDNTGKDFTRPYGSTLLAALITDTFLLTMQLGDGDIVLVFEDGKVEKPIPPDTRHLANETTSLCTSTAANDFKRQFRLQSQLPALVLLSTDGYANSFSTEAGFLKVGTDIWQMMRDEGGVQKVEDNLHLWLQAATNTGSGDDITLGILYQQEALKKEVPQEKPLEEKKDGGLSPEQENHNKNGGETLNTVMPTHGEKKNANVVVTLPLQNREVVATSTTQDNSLTEKQKASSGNLPGTTMKDSIADEQTTLLHSAQLDTQNTEQRQFKIGGRQE